MRYSRPPDFDLVPDDFAASDFIASLKALVKEKAGITLIQSTDFQALEAACTAAEGRDPVSVMFSQKMFDLGPGNAFWIGGYDDRGRLVHSQAMRRDSLGGLSLGQHLSQQIRRLYVDGNEDAVALNQICDVASMLGGTVVYHGEMWIHPDLRNAGLGSRLCRLCLATALVRWKPDWVYGFVERSIPLSGLSTRYGYLHHEPMAMEWERAPGLFDPNEWLVYASRLDLCKLIMKPAWDL